MFAQSEAGPSRSPPKYSHRDDSRVPVTSARDVAVVTDRYASAAGSTGGPSTASGPLAPIDHPLSPLEHPLGAGPGLHHNYSHNRSHHHSRTRQPPHLHRNAPSSEGQQRRQSRPRTPLPDTEGTDSHGGYFPPASSSTGASYARLHRPESGGSARAAVSDGSGGGVAPEAELLGLPPSRVLEPRSRGRGTTVSSKSSGQRGKAEPAGGNVDIEAGAGSPSGGDDPPGPNRSAFGIPPSRNGSNAVPIESAAGTARGQRGSGRVNLPAAADQGEGITESLSREEMAVARTRFDLLTNAELEAYIAAFALRPPASSTSTGAAGIGRQRGREESCDSLSGSDRGSGSRVLEPGNEADALFPPSPPSEAAPTRTLDHPLRIMARAVLELQETVDRLRRENEELRAEVVAQGAGRGTGRTAGAKDKGKGKSRAADEVSLHHGLSEAISTSLTSPSILAVHHQATENPHSSPLPDPAPLRIPSPTPSHRTAHSTQSLLSPASLPPPPKYTPTATYAPSVHSVKSARSGHSVDSGAVSAAGAPGEQSTPARKREIRGSWTASLWGWSGGKKGAGGTAGGRARQGSVGSVSSLGQAILGQSGLRNEGNGEDPCEAVVLDAAEDEEAWRKGDGGSSPGFRAIFLATRLITPDPTSILHLSHISPSSLVARSAHHLVSTARDAGIDVRDQPGGRRRSSKENRSRAASVMSQDVTSPGSVVLSSGTGAIDKNKGSNGYGDALLATASYGRSLLSTVSHATLRAPRATPAEASQTRPSLLNRASSSRFPTTAISAPSLAAAAASSRASEDISPTETPLPSVEMASIVPDEHQPPTVLLSRKDLGSFFQSVKVPRGTMQTASRFKSSEPPLTDRYGFIYDIQHAKMLKDASEARTAAPASLNGTIPGVDVDDLWVERKRRPSADDRPASVRSMDAADPAHTRSRRSIDANIPAKPAASIETSASATPGSITPPTSRSSAHASSHHPEQTHRYRSSTLINLNPPPAKPSTAKDMLVVSARGASSLQPQSPATLSPADSVSGALPNPDAIPVPTPSAVSRATVSSLLDQLTELHDHQQKERKADWDAWLRRRKRQVAEQEVGWSTDLVGISQMGLSKNAEEWRAFAKLVRRGIPMVYRSDVWAECSGAKDAMIPGEYREILSVHKGDKSPVEADIEKDVGRTFPGNVFFGGDGPGVAKLRRVLVAYSWRNPAVGYCQGMNMLAATLLLTHTEEEQAFWVLCAVIDRLLPADFYSPNLLASRADQMVLGDLVGQHLPKVAAHLDELGVDLASITFGWFLSLFTDCLPVETLFRVWDVFFVEGHDTLFRVAIAILKMNEAEVRACESASDLFALVASMTSRLWSADKLIALQHNLKPIIRHVDISGKYSAHLAALQDTA